jgi:spore coat polysaccharide biosynthesis protein SpsF (cytidylyltransferase family)
LRLTIDTSEDLEFAQVISQNLYKGIPYPIIDIVNFLKSNHQFLSINSMVKQRSMTHYEKCEKSDTK